LHAVSKVALFGSLVLAFAVSTVVGLALGMRRSLP
jgi:hypothetical protein